MIRTRFLAAALLALPLAACEVDNSQLPEGAPKSEAADSLGDVKAALAALPSAQVIGSHDDGVPFMLKGSLDNTNGLQGIAAAAGARPDDRSAHTAMVRRPSDSSVVPPRSPPCADGRPATEPSSKIAVAPRIVEG